MCCVTTWLRALHAKSQDELQALLQLDAAIKLRPDFMKARELAASLYVGRGDSSRALARLKPTEIIAKNNGSILARSHLKVRCQRPAEHGPARPGPQGTGIHPEDLPG